MGKTVYDDMERTEAGVPPSDLDWTIVRPQGPRASPAVGTRSATGSHRRAHHGREDLAAMLLDQLDDDRLVPTFAAVITLGLTVGPWTMLRRDVLER